MYLHSAGETHPGNQWDLDLIRNLLAPQKILLQTYVVDTETLVTGLKQQM